MSDFKRLALVGGVVACVLVLMFVFILHWAMHAELTLTCTNEQDRIPRHRAVQRCEDWYQAIARNARSELYACFFRQRSNGSIDAYNCLIAKGFEP